MYHKDITDRPRYPMLILRPDGAKVSSAPEMVPREWSTPVELHIERGTKQAEVLEVLARLTDAVKEQWDRFITDPLNQAQSEQDAARELLTPTGKKGGAK
jgi:hypothetical protein